MDRYWAYVDLMTKAKGELLPLGDFSPMGKRQAHFLDQLIALDVENFAANACAQVCRELDTDAVFRVMLVVVDEPSNGWTQRFLTDADGRFSSAIEKLKKSSDHFDRWVAVQLWTADHHLKPVEPSLELVQQATRGALFRAYWQRQHGYPVTLRHMLKQEGHVLRFSQPSLEFDPATATQLKSIIDPLLDSEDYTKNISALYGDEAAISVGYEPLGLPQYAGFAYAAAHLEQL